MKNIVFIGNSSAFVSCIQAIREKDKDSAITILTHDGSYPYRRSILPDIIGKEVSVEDLSCQPKSFYKEYNVRVILNRTLSCINLQRKRIYTEEKQQLTFDYLILSGLPEGSYLSPLKGVKKEGVYSLRKIQHVDKLMKELPFFESVFIQSSSFSSLRLAAVLIKQGKEVYLLSENNSFLSDLFNEEDKNNLLTSLSQGRLHIIENAGIREILGDSEVKAVRLSSGRIYGVQRVILGEIPENVKFLDNSDLKAIDGFFDVDRNYQTQTKGVFMIDALSCRHENDLWDDFVTEEALEGEGIKVAESIVEGVCVYNVKTVIQSVDIEEHKFIIVYSTDTKNLKTIRVFSNREENKYFCLYADGTGVIYLAYLINCEESVEIVKSLIENKEKLEDVNLSDEWDQGDSVSINTNKKMDVSYEEGFINEVGV